MTVARRKEEDKSRSAFTHFLGSDSSSRPLSFIIPLLCLKLYSGVGGGVGGGLEVYCVCDSFLISPEGNPGMGLAL